MRPRAVGVHGQEVYVIDTTGRVQVFDFKGTHLRQWETPAAENGTPTAIAFHDDRVLIPDTHYSRVLEYSRDGELLDEWGSYGSGPDEFIYPTGIARGEHGDYFLSEYGEDAERVHVFDAKRGFLRAWGGHGTAPGQFNRAMAVVADEQGAVYVCDTANHRIQCFEEDGTLVRVIGGPGTGSGTLDFPYDIALAPADTLFVCEYGTSRISQFRRDGAFVRSYGRPGRNAGEFNAPRGVAVTPNGAVFVADTENHRIQCFELEAVT